MKITLEQMMAVRNALRFILEQEKGISDAPEVFQRAELDEALHRFLLGHDEAAGLEKLVALLERRPA